MPRKTTLPKSLIIYIRNINRGNSKKQQVDDPKVNGLSTSYYEVE